jgi:hypothetical protein
MICSNVQLEITHCPHTQIISLKKPLTFLRIQAYALPIPQH